MNRVFLKVIYLFLAGLILAGCSFISSIRPATPTTIPPTVTSTTQPTAAIAPTETQTPTETAAPHLVGETPTGTSHAVKLNEYMDVGSEPGQWIGGVSWLGKSTFDYQGGVVLLAGSEDGSLPFGLDDALRLTILQPDGTLGTFYYEMYDPDCAGGMVCDAGPFDLTEYFSPGLNFIKLEIIDLYPGSWGASELFLVEFTAIK
jgi:hypothetical protein